MAKELKYTSSIKSMPLMFSEMKRTALLLCEGKMANEILQLSLEKNIYQFNNDKWRREVPLRMIKRLSTIGTPLLKILAHGTLDEAKLVTFLAFMKSDRLLYEFMREVYLDKAQVGYDEISDIDFVQFFDRKVSNSDTVAKWKTDTLKAIHTKIKNTLCDAGLAKRNKNKHRNNLLILRPIYTEDICMQLEEQDRIYAKAMLLEV